MLDKKCSLVLTEGTTGKYPVKSKRVSIRVVREGAAQVHAFTNNTKVLYQEDKNKSITNL